MLERYDRTNADNIRQEGIPENAWTQGSYMNCERGTLRNAAGKSRFIQNRLAVKSVQAL
jgi:hypothetical protein